VLDISLKDGYNRIANISKKRGSISRWLGGHHWCYPWQRNGDRT